MKIKHTKKTNNSVTCHEHTKYCRGYRQGKKKLNIIIIRNMNENVISATHDVVPHHFSSRFCLTLRWSPASQDCKQFCKAFKLNFHQGAWCAHYVANQYGDAMQVLGGAHYVANQSGDASFFHVLCKICPGSCSGLIDLSSSIAAAAAAVAERNAVVAHYIAQEVPADRAMRMPS